MIVVDANVIAYLLMRGERSEAMDRLQDFDPEWAAPRLWLDEVLNVLCTYERNGGIGSDQAVKILENALALM
jgi:predicted nucleic acid-binding protein